MTDAYENKFDFLSIVCYTYNNQEDNMTIQDIKSKVRKLKKIRKSLRVGSSERDSVNTQLKSLKEQLKSLVDTPGEKQEVIDEITTIYTKRRYPFIVDFRNYTVEELERHLYRIKNGGGIFG